MNQSAWYHISNIETLDSPALVFYEERIAENIHQAIIRVPDLDNLRPHVKTNKSADVCSMLMKEGITKFKCATIAEAEMLGSIKAKDVLLAYQPVGPKINRLFELVRHYPATQYSCLVDNAATANEISRLFISQKLNINIFIDINVGMNRTGILPEKVLALCEEIVSYSGITIAGLHMYDGQITDSDIVVRQKRARSEYEKVRLLRNSIQEKFGIHLAIVAGGSPTFPVYAEYSDVECSPGTFVLWDWNYKHTYPEEPFDYAALVVTRVVSITSPTMMTIDLGHKSIAAENPLPRVHFLNAPDVVPVSHSEEHMSVKVSDTGAWKIGDVLYGVPAHICPTVALYERASVVENKKIISEWKITARDKRITL